MRGLRWMVGLALLVGAGQPVWAELGVQGGSVIPGGLQVTRCSSEATEAPSASGSRTCNSLLSGETTIYGYKVVNEAANTRFALYDAVRSPNSSPANFSTLKDEHYEATADKTGVHLYLSPIKFSTAVSVDIQGDDATIFLYY